MHTPKLRHLTSTDFQSSVPANDHYGTPQVEYLEDNPSDGFLTSSRNGTAQELYDESDESSEGEMPELIDRHLAEHPIWDDSDDESSESLSEEENMPALTKRATKRVVPTTPQDDSPLTDRTVSPEDESIYRDPIIASPKRRSTRATRPRDFWNPAVSTDLTSFVNSVLDRDNYEQVKELMFDAEHDFTFAANAAGRRRGIPYRWRSHALYANTTITQVHRQATSKGP